MIFLNVDKAIIFLKSIPKFAITPDINIVILEIIKIYSLYFKSINIS